MRRLLVVLAAGLALALGIGLTAGGSTGVPGAASLVPADAAAFVSVDTDLSSAQVRQLGDLLGGQDQLLALLRAATGHAKLDFDRDVRPALGPELDLAWLDASSRGRDVVALLQPRDPAALTALLARAKPAPATASVRGWTVVAASSAVLARAEQALAGGGPKLADDAGFRDALAAQPADALARGYASGAALGDALAGGANGCTGLVGADWIGGALAATDGGLTLQAQAKSATAPAGAAVAPPFASQIPGGVLAYAGFSQLGAALDELRTRCPGAFKSLDAGVPLSDLASLVAGDGAFYVRSGLLLPEVTLVLAAPDPAKALATVDALLASRGAKPQATQVDGIAAKRVALTGTPISLVYAAFDGKLVVTDSNAAFSELRSTSGPKLADDAAFRAARTAAGVPDATLGLLYVDLKDALPLARMLGGASGGKIPPAVDAVTSRLKTLLVWGTRDGDRSTLHGFLSLGG